MCIRDSSHIGLIYTGQQVEYRRLTGAVGADQAIELALLDGYAEIIHGAQSAERDAEVFNFK